MNILGIIPARYTSLRFPGKPLAMIDGKSMIQRVYEQAVKADSLKWLVVATDNREIYNHVRRFGGMVMMTSDNHPNGTSRCLEVTNKLEAEHKNISIDAVINIQGDEPYIQPVQIDALAGLFMDSATDIATLAKKIDHNEQVFDPNVVKVVVNNEGFAMLFSRQAVPFGRDLPQMEWFNRFNYLKHIGIYGYRNTVLKKIVDLPVSPLEGFEKLEQLRWLENGYNIKVELTDYESMSVDTPEDLKKLLQTIQK